ncbi:hypothetical protein BGX34_009998 [Mortierella sp. NVP85]|nr:hypothetical protein BGX34_009998 [Mortierella sp. NVP85]
MLAGRILTWAFLGSLVFAAPLNRTTDIALDDREVSVYNDEMTLLFHGTHRELVSNNTLQVKQALDWGTMCFEAIKATRPLLIKTYNTYTGENRQDALVCLRGLRTVVSKDCSTKHFKAGSGLCRCGISLGPEADNIGAMDESPNNYLTIVTERIERGAFSGTFTGEWGVGSKHFVGFVVDCRNDYSGVDNVQARWKAGQVAANQDSSTQGWADYFKRYVRDLK